MVQFFEIDPTSSYFRAGLLGLGLQNEATMIVVVFSSLPASASAYVMAHQMGGDAELMASILAIQTLFSVFLLSGILVYFTPL